MANKVYERIEYVLALAEVQGRSLAPHEFSSITVVSYKDSTCTEIVCGRDGREFVGCSESTLGRRMREMVVLKRLTSKTREGKTFKEFALADCCNRENVQQNHAPGCKSEPVAA